MCTKNMIDFSAARTFTSTSKSSVINVPLDVSSDYPGLGLNI